MPTLDQIDLDQIRASVRAEVTTPIRPDRILTLEEAIVYTKHRTERAFRRWGRKYYLTLSAPSCYAVSRLEGALQRECDGRGRR